MSQEILRNPDEPDYDQIEESILFSIRRRNALGLPSDVVQKEKFVDVTFCCHVSSMEMSIFLNNAGYRKRGGIPKKSAFATTALEPEIVPIAIGRFKAHLTTDDDHSQYVEALSKAKSLGESARIGLSLKNCGQHDLPLIKPK